MPRKITTDELRVLLQPYVGIRLNGPRDYANGYDAIDIIRLGLEMRDADIRELTDEGVVCFRNHACTTIRWADIRMVRARRCTTYNQLGLIEFDVAADLQVAA